MEPEAKYALVGTVALILVALMAWAIVWLLSTGEGRDARRYVVYFRTQSLQGLEPRSDVTMRGIRVGSVIGFRFTPRHPGAIEATIAVDPNAPVRQNTRATIERNFVTGLARMQLSNPDENAPLLVQAPPGEPYPVIAEGESTIQQVSETLTTLASRLGATMQRLDAVLSPENQAAFSETLANLRSASGRIDGLVAKAGGTLGTVDSAAAEVRTLAKSVAGDVHTLARRYDALGASADASVKDFGEAMRKVSADVDRLTQRLDKLAATGDVELRETARSLRSAADALGAAAGRLRDPRQVIYGPAEGALGPGESRR